MEDEEPGNSSGSGTVRMWHPPAAALHSASSASLPPAGQQGAGRQSTQQRQSMDAVAPRPAAGQRSAKPAPQADAESCAVAILMTFAGNSSAQQGQ